MKYNLNVELVVFIEVRQINIMSVGGVMLWIDPVNDFKSSVKTPYSVQYTDIGF